MKNRLLLHPFIGIYMRKAITIIFTLLVLLPNELFAQSKISQEESRRVISIVRGNDYLISDKAQIYGEKLSMFGGPIHYMVSEIPLEATKSKSGKYTADVTKYMLLEDNL